MTLQVTRGNLCGYDALILWDSLGLFRLFEIVIVVLLWILLRSFGRFFLWRQLVGLSLFLRCSCPRLLRLSFDNCCLRVHTRSLLWRLRLVRILPLTRWLDLLRNWLFLLSGVCADVTLLGRVLAHFLLLLLPRFRFWRELVHPLSLLSLLLLGNGAWVGTPCHFGMLLPERRLFIACSKAIRVIKLPCRALASLLLNRLLDFSGFGWRIASQILSKILVVRLVLDQ